MARRMIITSPTKTLKLTQDSQLPFRTKPRCSSHAPPFVLLNNLKMRSIVSLSILASLATAYSSDLAFYVARLRSCGSRTLTTTPSSASPPGWRRPRGITKPQFSSASACLVAKTANWRDSLTSTAAVMGCPTIQPTPYSRPSHLLLQRPMFHPPPLFLFHMTAMFTMFFADSSLTYSMPDQSPHSAGLTNPDLVLRQSKYSILPSRHQWASLQHAAKSQPRAHWCSAYAKVQVLVILYEAVFAGGVMMSTVQSLNRMWFPHLSPSKIHEFSSPFHMHAFLK